MLKYHFHFFPVAISFLLGPLSLSVFSQNFIVNGVLERKDHAMDVKDAIVRKKTLLVKDKRIYIQIVLDEGARNVTNHKRYKEMSYLLPKEIVYDEAARRIFYYTDNAEIEIGREKSFLGFMSYIALADGVTIIGSPTDAKLLISLNTDYKGMPHSVIHSEEEMEITLEKKCGQCHILEYIFSHENWVEEDILHAFNRLQMGNEERFTPDEQKIIDLFKKYQKGEIDKGKLSEFKSLKEIGTKDVAAFAEGVYMNNCVPCHNPSKMADVSLLYTKRRCKSIVDRMKEKEPSLFLQKDLDSLASYLWEIKLRPYGK
ncbi:MAG: hypothetical protein B6D35_09365 [Candidatus Brocadia sp. UTAMX2]|jgi:hypothetical protein|nr:MAG: hypothetical protein B6D35_09365 [Candidatus Brocadia sp. UTAMX2]